MTRQLHQSSNDLVPTPFVTWQVVACASDPAEEPSRARYRTLRKNGRSTQGVRVFGRSSSGASGSSTFHSVLNVLATHARKEGDDSVADELMKRADRVESRFGDDLSKFLAKCPYDDLPESPFYADLLEETSLALQSAGPWKAFYASAAITSIIDGVAHLDGELSDGNAAAVDLPRQAIDAWRLATGDRVLVFQRMMLNSVLVDVLPVAKLAGGDQVRSAERADALMWPKRDAEEVARLRRVVTSGGSGVRPLRPAG